MINSEINEKLFEIKEILNNDIEIKEFNRLKNEILKDKKLCALFDQLHKLNEYDDSIELKKKIISDEKIIKYRYLEEKVYFMTLEINKRFKTLIDKKVC